MGQWSSDNPCGTQGNRFLKFSETYGLKAHQDLAERGLAPALIGNTVSSSVVEHVPSQMCITMDNLENYMSLYDLQKYFRDPKTPLNDLGWFPKALLDQCRDILQALRHTGNVHGDLRAPNIMITKPTDGKWPGNEFVLKVVDFDWAGPCGEVYYPLHLSVKITWPAGVESGAAIIHEHDEESVQMMLLDMFSPEQEGCYEAMPDAVA